MNIDHDNLNILAKDIIKNVKENFLNSDGLISRNFPTSKRTIFDNFDDVVPFFIYFDELDFLVNQIKASSKFTFNELLADENLICSYNIDEYLGGLYALWKKTSDERVKVSLETALEKIKGYFVSQNNIWGDYDLNSGKTSAYYYSRSAGLLETFIEMAPDYPNLLNLSEDIIQKWIESDFFKENSLFPYRSTDSRVLELFNAISSRFGSFCYGKPLILKDSPLNYTKGIIKNIIYTYLKSGNYVFLMKSNTTPVFTLIELFRKTGEKKYKDTITKWVKAASSKLVKDGLVYGKYYPKTKTRENPSLVNSFILIDVLMDAYFYVDKNNDYLELTRKIIDRSLASKWDSGLIPLSESHEITHIDSLVDFSIALRRFSELTGESSYLTEATQLMLSTIKHHKTNSGYATHIKKDLSVFSKTTFNIVDPKYNILFLKGIINLLTLDQKIYGNDDLHNLFKDR